MFNIFISNKILFENVDQYLDQYYNGNCLKQCFSMGVISIFSIYN
jgi:hypothetical protein